MSDSVKIFAQSLGQKEIIILRSIYTYELQAFGLHGLHSDPAIFWPVRLSLAQERQSRST